MSERDYAKRLADAVLDRPNADPDDDLALLARNFVRSGERADRAEALLRETQEALRKLASRTTYFENDLATGLSVYVLDRPVGIAFDAFAKVRALLEGDK